MRFSTIAAAAAAAGFAHAQNATESVCDKYTVALLMDNTAANQLALLTLLVKTVVIGNFTGPGTSFPDLPGSMNTVPGILAAGEVDGTAVELAGYFNGSILSTNRGGDAGESVNFLDSTMEDFTEAMALGRDGSNQATLLLHLIQFFGAALGCSMYGTDGYPAYGGETSMASVHQYMDLSYAENTYFIQQVGLAATSFGASMEDVTGVAMLLNSTFNQRCAPPVAVLPDADEEYQVICVQSDCPLATNAESTCTASDAGFGTFVGIEPSTMAAVDMTTMTEPTMTESTATETDTVTETETDTATVTETATETTGTGTDDNGAPRQTAAAGVMAMAGIVAAAFL